MFKYNDVNNMLCFVLNPQNTVDKAQLDRAKWVNIWYGVLSNIMTGIFTYENMSNQLIKRLERAFFNSGYVCAYEDANCGIIVAPCTPVGNINAWGEYSSYSVVLPNGDTKRVNLEECVIGYNYYMPTVADSVLCYEYAQQIAELKLSINNAIILSRKTGLIEVPSENAVNEVLTQFNNHTIGVPIIVTKKRPENDFKTLELANPNSIDDYYNGLRDILNEFLTTTGLSSLVNPNKKERLIVDEVNSNDDIKNTLLANRIDNRVAFIDATNEKFNTNYSVSVSDSIYRAVNDLVNTNEGGSKDVD